MAGKRLENGIVFLLLVLKGNDFIKFKCFPGI